MPRVPLTTLLRTDDDLRVPDRTLLPVAAVTWLLILLLGLVLVL